MQGLRGEELGMREVIWEWHTGSEVPATWHRGSDPINGVWAMEDITPVAVMLLGSDKGVGDHRVIVLDVLDWEICGYLVPRIQPLEVHRLTRGILLSQKNYISQLRDWFSCRGIPDRVDQLAWEISGLMTLAQKAEMERLDCTMVREWQEAERECRKLWLEAHPYSKQLSVAWKCISVWCMVVKCKKGGQVNSTKIN